MIGLRLNQLVEFVDDARTERVLWIDRPAGGYFMIDIADSAASPIFREADQVAQLFAEGGARDVPDDPWLAAVNETAIAEQHKARRDKSWAMIKPLLAQQPEIFRPNARAQSVNRLVEETGASRHSLYRLLRRYWQRGMTPNALLPDYDRCGGRGKSKTVSEKKRGFPAASGVTGINIDPDMRDLFRAVATRYFAVNRRMDLAGCYHELLDGYYTDTVLDERTGRQKAILRPQHPSPRQFRYWFEKDNDVFRIKRRRRTPRIYDKDMRALPSTSTSEVFGPGSRFQIDATIADVYLVSRLNPNKIVGRPVLYVVIDVFSRMIVGLYVGFEGPSWVGAMMAIANAATEKVSFCRQFGIEIDEAEWPCQSLPNVLLGDRGEMLGPAVETLINNFHVEVENSAPYRADWKGIVEQRFRLLPAAFKAYTPGYIETDYKQRGARDYRLDGKLDIDQFTATIIECVRYYNTEHPIHDYERDGQMIADEVMAIPVELWEWGVVRRTGLQRSFPSDLVKLSLLPSDEATVTAHGIRFYGCYYTCQKAITEHWFEKARQKGLWNVRISYEPRCLDEIYLHGGAGRANFLPCAMTDRSAAYRGKTLWEIDQIRLEERQRQNAYAPQVRQGRINLNRRIKTIVKDATTNLAASPSAPDSDRQRVKGIRSNRRAERQENQKREAFRFGTTVLPPPDGGKVVPFSPNQPDDDYSLPSIAEIRQRQQGGLPDDDGR